MYKGIITIFIVLAFVFGTSYYLTIYKSNPLFEITATDTKQDDQSIVGKPNDIGRKINNKFYYNYETKHGTSLYFSFWDNPSKGTCVFKEGSFIDNNECRFRYSYIIENNEIHTTFLSSDCEGRTTTDRVFYYDEEKDIVYTLVNGDTFVFARDNSPYLQRGHRNIDMSPPTQSSSNNSGYSVGEDAKIYENAPCTLCGGTGIEKAVNSTGHDRICPQCEGKGHQSY